MDKQLGQVDQITINITKPMTMSHMDLKYNKLMLLIGNNGSGKSLILKLTWVLSYIVHLDFNAIQMRVLGFNTKTIAQWVFDNSFDDNNFTGEIIMVFRDSPIELGSSIRITLNEGKVEDLEILFESDLTTVSMPRFMSTNIRLFSNMKIYFKMRKAEGNTFNDDFMQKALDYYKLYDILMMELMIAKHTELSIEKLNEFLKRYDFKEEYKEFGFDQNAADFYLINSKDEKKYMSTYSNGEQSLVNMTIMASI